VLLSDEGDGTITVPVDERTYHAIDGCHLIATEFRFDEVDGAIQCKGQTVHAEFCHACAFSQGNRCKPITRTFRRETGLFSENMFCVLHQLTELLSFPLRDHEQLE